jgi:hypothetical protein
MGTFTMGFEYPKAAAALDKMAVSQEATPLTEDMYGMPRPETAAVAAEILVKALE